LDFIFDGFLKSLAKLENFTFSGIWGENLMNLSSFTQFRLETSQTKLENQKKILLSFL